MALALAVTLVTQSLLRPVVPIAMRTASRGAASRCMDAHARKQLADDRGRVGSKRCDLGPQP